MAKVKVVSEPWRVRGRNVVCFEIEVVEGTIVVGMRMILPPIASIGEKVIVESIEHLSKFPKPNGWGICVSNETFLDLEIWKSLDLQGKTLEIIK